jgi:uncharacterized membrane protein YhaH (DUF805 family)
MLVSVGVSIVLNIIMAAGGSGSTSNPGAGYIMGVVLVGFWLLATIIPSLALAVRRLHDVNLSGWMLLLGLIPFVGAIVLLVFTLLESKPQGQRFDANGLQAGAWK